MKKIMLMIAAATLVTAAMAQDVAKPVTTQTKAKPATSQTSVTPAAPVKPARPMAEKKVGEKKKLHHKHAVKPAKS